MAPVSSREETVRWHHQFILDLGYRALDTSLTDKELVMSALSTLGWVSGTFTWVSEYKAG